MRLKRRMSLTIFRKRGRRRLLRCANSVFRSVPAYSMPRGWSEYENDISVLCVATFSSANKRVRSG